jgi:hypothetical protein
MQTLKKRKGSHHRQNKLGKQLLKAPVVVAVAAEAVAAVVLIHLLRQLLILQLQLYLQT